MGLVLEQWAICPSPPISPPGPGLPLIKRPAWQPPATPTRQIRGCIPGEPVYVNGIVIGRATADVVVLRNGQESIEPVSGLLPKPHGLEKLAAKGEYRYQFRLVQERDRPISRSPRRLPADRYGRVVVIDHCGHEMYTRMGADCCGVLAIGDDTTASAGTSAHTGASRSSASPTMIAMPSSPHPLHRDRLSLIPGPGATMMWARRLPHTIPEGMVCWDEWVHEDRRPLHLPVHCCS